MATDRDIEAAATRLQSFLDAPEAYPLDTRDLVRLLLHVYKRQQGHPVEKYVERAARDMAGVPRKQVKLHGTSVPLKKGR